MSEKKTLRERIEQWKRPATCKCASCFTQLFYNSGIVEALEEAVPWIAAQSYYSINGEVNHWVDRYGYTPPEPELPVEQKEYMQDLGSGLGKALVKSFLEAFRETEADKGK